jgi:hypothetical protein
MEEKILSMRNSHFSYEPWTSIGFRWNMGDWSTGAGEAAWGSTTARAMGGPVVLSGWDRWKVKRLGTTTSGSQNHTILFWVECVLRCLVLILCSSFR